MRRNLWHDPETMKGTVALVVLALVATWAVLFYQPAKPSEPRAKSAASAHGATPAQPQEAVPQPAKPRAPELELGQGTTPPAAMPTPRTDTVQSSAASHQGDVRVLGESTNATVAQAPKSATQLAQPLDDQLEYRKPTGELGEGILSPDYKLLEESYVEEARDGAWATQQELRIRNQLLAGDLGERIVLINCQSSVCRVQLEPRGNDPYGELLRVPGLAETLGIDPSTPYSLNSAELIVYAKPEPIPEAPKN
jgi:hypothetical protein